jgi:cobalt-zinc-cadmium efflux system outer membrane protein
MTSSRHLHAASLAILLSACASAPPAPLDPESSAHRLEARSLDDPRVAAALARTGLSTASGWTLDSLTVAAWALRPEIAVAAADVAIAAAAERTAAELPNPTLSLDPAYLYDNASGALSPWTLAASLGFTIETGGKRDIRKAQSRAESNVRRWQLAEATWQARQDIRKALIARLVAQLTLATAEREIALRQSFSAWVENAFRFGAVAQTDRLTAATSLAQAQGTLRTARGDLAAADAALAAAVGVTTDHFPFKTLTAPLTDMLPNPGGAETLRDEALINRLTVRRALADYGVTEQALRMAVAKQYPDISFGPGYVYDKGDRGVTLNLGFTLPLFHGAQAAIDEALAARAKAATQFEAAQGTALAEIETASARYGAALAAWSESKTAEAAGDQAVAAVDRRLAMGAADRGEVVTAGLVQIASRRATLDALRAALDALGAIEDGLQRPLWPASTLVVPRPDAPSSSTAAK